jgi:hypothetical protein
VDPAVEVVVAAVVSVVDVGAIVLEGEVVGSMVELADPHDASSEAPASRATATAILYT